MELKADWQIPSVHMFHTLGKMKDRVARDGEKEGEFRILGEHKVLEDADRIVAATLAEYAQLQWLYKADTRKIVIIPPGVDLSRFYPIQMDEAREYVGLHEPGDLLLFVGRIEPLKGIDTLNPCTGPHEGEWGDDSASNLPLDYWGGAGCQPGTDVCGDGPLAGTIF